MLWLNHLLTYAQNAYKFHEGTLKIAFDKTLQLGVKLKTTNKKSTTNNVPVEEKSETWFRKTPKSRLPRHFNVKSPCKYTSLKSKPSSYLKKRRQQTRNAKGSGKV